MQEAHLARSQKMAEFLASLEAKYQKEVEKASEEASVQVQRKQSDQSSSQPTTAPSICTRPIKKAEIQDIQETHTPSNDKKPAAMKPCKIMISTEENF